MSVDIPGLVTVIVFYVAIVVTGILAAYLTKKKRKATNNEVQQHDGQRKSTFLDESLVAGRDIGLVVGIFTMSATAVGGGFISGVTEGIATSGMVWTIFPLTIFIGLIIGALVFAKPMRSRRYITMLDPLQEKYGDVMTGLLLLAALLAEVMWGATILLALGTNLSVIINLDTNVSMIVSACVAVVYTLFGQMVSVAYTDVLQFGFVVVGMVLCVPFVLTHEHIGDISTTRSEWVGSIDGKLAPAWCDFFIAQTLGSIPWNTYFMRVLSARTVRYAQLLSVIGGTITLVMAIPPFLIGAASTVADWNETDYGSDPVPDDVAKLFPLVIESFTPKAVSIIALAAVAAAVMSSMDSIILSCGSMFTRNIYQLSVRPKAHEMELKVVLWISMLVVTVASLLLAIYVDTIFGLYVLTADILYVCVFPQLVCAVFIQFVNPYGSLAGFIVSAVLRFGGGEDTLDLKPFIHYPNYDDELGQLFPFKTFTMLCSLFCIVTVSLLTNYIFQRKILPANWDISGKVAVEQNGLISNDGHSQISAHSVDKDPLPQSAHNNSAYESSHL